MDSALKSDVNALWDQTKAAFDMSGVRLSEVRTRIAQLREREPSTNAGLKDLEDAIIQVQEVLGQKTIDLDDNRDGLIEGMVNESTDTDTEPEQPEGNRQGESKDEIGD